MLSTRGLFLAPKWILLIYRTFSPSDPNITLEHRTLQGIFELLTLKFMKQVSVTAGDESALTSA